MSRPSSSYRGGPRAAVLALLVLQWGLGREKAAAAQELQNAPRADQIGNLEPSLPILAVNDPQLAPPPVAPRVLRSWLEALSLARAQSPDYATSQAQVRAAEARSSAALANLFPTINGQGSYTHQFLTDTVSFGTSQFTVPPPNVWGASAALVWPLGHPRAFYGLGTAKRDVEANRLSFAEARRQIALGVVNAMLATLAAVRVAEFNRVGLQAALERLALTEAKLRYRQGTALDVDRAEADVARARVQLIDGDETLQQSREALGLAVGSSVAVAAPGDLDLIQFEKEVVTSCRMSEGIESRPDVAASRMRLEVAEREVTDVGLQYMPSFSLQSQAAYTSAVTFGPRTVASVVGVVNLPIFDGARVGRLRESQANAVRARAALVLARLNATIDVVRAKRAVTVALSLRDVAERQRELAQRIDYRTRESYTHGLGTSLDLVTSGQGLRLAENNWILAVVQSSRARVDAVLALADCPY